MFEKGHFVSEKTRKNLKEAGIGSKNSFYGKHHTKEWKQKQREINTGEKSPSYGKPCSKITREKIGKANRIGDGITPINDLIRKSLEYKLWRKSVIQRDNFICQKYGTRGGRLVAHHINNFADFPELRLAIDNGITLSEKAHKEFHKIYGNRNNNKEQIMEFIK